MTVGLECEFQGTSTVRGGSVSGEVRGLALI